MRHEAIPLAIVLISLSGCDQYEQEAVVAQPPATSSDPGVADDARTAGPSSQQAGARPSYAGARQAAKNTLDKINERQAELEQAMEDPY